MKQCLKNREMAQVKKHSTRILLSVSYQAKHKVTNTFTLELETSLACCSCMETRVTMYSRNAITEKQNHDIPSKCNYPKVNKSIKKRFQLQFSFRVNFLCIFKIFIIIYIMRNIISHSLTLKINLVGNMVGSST